MTADEKDTQQGSPRPPYTGGRWDDLELRVVDDVPDVEEGKGMTPDEIQAFLDRPVRPEKEGQ